ncbi:D-aminoacyl-tRNA deacylase [Helcobacillus massiliensis]|uniref:D-aminoacyl-tRNA deacylase n=1 Tax=Helcobacillus massiliensis TaxID=521392 RepID=A0A839QTJ3_9MICO|nr:D-aminoacyl-tRNA deacylase [Helcobacillus massiliensis]MBB3023055.1 D-tyrosyl-tRNA(Tyr) deacylase [Helcobacillus massiliensis]MCT1558364.1 D-aminoacyl-tRNA deacylase [Helcobacillus massiliensis]MCT2036864.1 D-aminoacyl-tRNA deacylase [Helcobacillus massiliensis]MCT2332645.1 D-aminoacyl-tRNA deacylase [Helcobacillus massiliensis]MDK7741503.1 D-aminoacyl-tRNA deacylase [Helcobacillus massiliensis]
MRAVLQRVSSASVAVLDDDTGERRDHSRIDSEGLLVLLGVTHDDGEEQVQTIARKIAELRILSGEKSATDLDAPILVVSQFTLYADVRKGRRPSWNQAAPGPVAEPLVARVVEELRSRGLTVAEGEFGAHMQVSLVNDGPVTILVEA